MANCGLSFWLCPPDGSRIGHQRFGSKSGLVLIFRNDSTSMIKINRCRPRLTFHQPHLIRNEGARLGLMPIVSSNRAGARMLTKSFRVSGLIDDLYLPRANRIASADEILPGV